MFATDGAVLGHAGPDDDLRWTLSIARGAEEIDAALPREQLELLAWAGDRHDCFAECRATDRSVFLAVQARQGTIVRALRLACARIEPAPGAPEGEPGPWPDARPVVEAYLGRLRAADFPGAAAFFAEDCLYSHPPYGGGHERVVYRSREALLHGFVNDRGPTQAIQVITGFAQDGASAFVEGVVDGLENGGTWGASCTIAPDGLIRRYLAFYGTPRVPRLGAN